MKQKKETIASTIIEKKYLDLILKKISPWVTYQNYPPGTRFSWDKNNQTKCYIIKNGVLSFYRQPDDILIDYVTGPSLRGIIPIGDVFDSLYALKVIECSSICVLDNVLFYQLLTDLQLWELYARHLEEMLRVAPEIMFRINSKTLYSAVRFQLYELISKPLNIREKINVDVFIRDKTQASRSSIMQILSDLKRGGHIHIERGILKSVAHIPKKY